MDTEVTAAPTDDRLARIAAPWHLALVLCVQIGLSVRGFLRSDQLRAITNPDRISLYQRTILFQWLVFALVIAGVRLHGTSLYTVMGKRWRSLHQLGADLGLGFLLLICSIILPAILGPHSQDQAERATEFLLPRGGAEIAWWIVLSLTAGFCEEVLFRGYLQQQFAAMTRNATTGILLSAVLFGAAHGYQGLRKAVIISIMGAVLGVAAHWRKSIRPGMVAHILQDVLGGLMRH